MWVSFTGKPLDIHLHHHLHLHPNVLSQCIFHPSHNPAPLTAKAELIKWLPRSKISPLLFE